jgi:hypothetical protein
MDHADVKWLRKDPLLTMLMIGAFIMILGMIAAFGAPVLFSGQCGETHGC